MTENGYHVANARLSRASQDDKWEVAVFTENITDEEYVVQSFDLAIVLGWIEEYYGRPRWVGGSVIYNFQALTTKRLAKANYALYGSVGFVF